MYSFVTDTKRTQHQE